MASFQSIPSKSVSNQTAIGPSKPHNKVKDELQLELDASNVAPIASH
jgi:hypothetical protein